MRIVASTAGGIGNSAGGVGLMLLGAGAVATAAAGGTAAGVEAANAILMLNGLGDVVVAGGCPPLHSGLAGFGSGFRCGLAHDVALLLRYQFQLGVFSLMLMVE